MPNDDKRCGTSKTDGQLKMQRIFRTWVTSILRATYLSLTSARSLTKFSMMTRLPMRTALSASIANLGLARMAAGISIILKMSSTLQLSSRNGSVRRLMKTSTQAAAGIREEQCREHQPGRFHLGRKVQFLDKHRTSHR